MGNDPPSINRGSPVRGGSGADAASASFDEPGSTPDRDLTPGAPSSLRNVFLVAGMTHRIPVRGKGSC